MGKNSPGYNDVRRARYATQKAAKLAQEKSGDAASSTARYAETVAAVDGPKKTKAQRKAAEDFTTGKPQVKEALIDVNPVVRTPKKAKPIVTKRWAETPAPQEKPKFTITDKTSKHSFQRGGKVAGGLTIDGGMRQFTISLTGAQADFVMRKASEHGLSTSEVLRQCVNAVSG